MSNAFMGQQLFEDFKQDLENERQDAFEHRIVGAILKCAGCPPHVLKIVRKRLNRGSDQECMDLRWFNQYCGFPFLVGTRRFAAGRTFEHMVTTQMPMRPNPSRSDEAQALQDLAEATDGRPVVLVTRYAHGAFDWALHRQLHAREDGSGLMILSDLLYAEPLSSFVAYAVGQYSWNPADHLPVSIRGEEP